MKTIASVFRRFFCKHNYSLLHDHNYEIIGAGGVKKGVLQIALYECNHCGSTRVIPHNRSST